MRRGAAWAELLSGGAGCILAASVLTLVMAAPVLRAPSERLFGSEIVGRFHDPFTVIRWFEHPTRPTLYTQPATDYLGAALAPLVGGVAAYNVVVLATFPLAALFTFLLARRLGASKPGAWLASLAYAFSPFHLAHSAYHPQVAQVQWIPLYLLALWSAFERPTGRRITLLALAAALAALSSFYSGLILAVLTPLAIVGQALSERAAGTPDLRRRTVTMLGALALIGSLGYGYVRTFAPRVLVRPSSFAFPASDVERYTARWTSYLMPPVWQPIVGAEVRAWWARQGAHEEILERQLSLGWGLLALAAVAGTLWLRRRRSDGLQNVPYLAILAASAFVCSLSPTWTVAGIVVPRPAGWLHRLAPMFRAYARFGMAVELTIALAAGLGLGALLRAEKRGARLVALGLVALFVVELPPFPPWHGRDVMPTSAHRWLIDHRAQGATLDCVPDSDSAQASAIDLFGPGLRLLAPGEDCGEADFASKLAARGFRHLIVRRGAPVSDWLERRGNPPGLRPVGSFRDALLFGVEAAPPPLEIDFGPGFQLREYFGSRSYRWMGSRARLTVIDRTAQPISARLRMVVNGFPGPRTLRLVPLRGGAEHEIRAGLEPRVVDVGPIDLLPGANPIELSTRDPAVVADRVLENGDTRALAISIGDLVARPVGSEDE